MAYNSAMMWISLTIIICLMTSSLGDESSHSAKGNEFSLGRDQLLEFGQISRNNTSNVRPHEEWIIKASDIPQDKKDGVVTMEFKRDTALGPQEVLEFYTKLRKLIAALMRRNPPRLTTTPGLGPVNMDSSETLPVSKTAGQFTSDDVIVVFVKPIHNQHLRTSVYANDKDGGVVNGNHLDGIMQINEDEFPIEIGETLEDSYVGLPSDVTAILAAEEESKPRSIWKAHFWFFITVLISLFVSIILAIILALCICCRRKNKPDHTSQKLLKKQQREPTELAA